MSAALAYACLNSVPLHAAEAIQLVDAIKPYLDWQSDVAYKAAPPPDYFYPPHDVYAALAKVKSNLQSNLYRNEYAFQADLYDVFAAGHDGHFVHHSSFSVFFLVLGSCQLHATLSLT